MASHPLPVRLSLAVLCAASIAAGSRALAQDQAPAAVAVSFEEDSAPSPAPGAERTLSEVALAVKSSSLAFSSTLNPEHASADPVAFGPQQTTEQTAAPAKKSSGEPAPDKRILGIIPNYRSVAVGAKLPPQTVKQKAVTSLQDTFDIGAFELAVIISLEEYATVATPEFHRGGAAYGRYLWHAFADQSIENELVEFIVPAITHEDTRYYTLGRGSVGRRLEYSLTRILVVRTDSGGRSVNYGEIVGAGAAAGISSLYYPSAERTTGKILDQYALNLGIDAASYVVREFDQDLSHLFRHKHPDAQTAP